MLPSQFNAAFLRAAGRLRRCARVQVGFEHRFSADVGRLDSFDGRHEFINRGLEPRLTAVITKRSQEQRHDEVLARFIEGMGNKAQFV